MSLFTPGNSFLPLAPAADDAARRAALADLIQAAETSEADARAITGQISAAVAHSGSATLELASAREATYAARTAAARTLANWISGGSVGEQPDTAGPVVDAQRAEAEATASVETIIGAIDALRGDLEAVNGRASNARAAVRVAVYRIEAAEAETLAQDILARDAATAIKRRRLMTYVRRLGGGQAMPAAARQAVSVSVPHLDTDSSAYQAENAAWHGWREALLQDATAQAGFPGT